MRIDHHAYQRAVRVAGTGFLLQAGIGLALLFFGLLGDDTVIVFASLPVLLGLLPWLALIVAFYQHKLERLEALEEDELVSGRDGEAASIFDRAGDEVRVAARRLRNIHQYFMPAVSIVLALALAGTAWLLIGRLQAIDEQLVELSLTEHRGWAVALALGFTAVAFIFSRFVAGMAKQDAWQNLRGGAAHTVNIAVLSLAVAAGIAFRFFANDTVMYGIAWAIPVAMIVLAVEIVFNFVLWLYRPRTAGETPRPAFDSKLLSLAAAPDNIVRTINDAVNYQFGFDITSSWGYQLLLRSFARLLALGAIVLIALNTIVVIEPYEQGIRLAHGKMLQDEPSGSGVLWKLPWPFQSAERFSVSEIRELDLTNRRTRNLGLHLWMNELSQDFDGEPDVFVTSGSRLAEDRLGDGVITGASDAAPANRRLSLVDTEIELQYRVRRDGGLMDLLRFVPDERRPRERFTDREKAIRHIARRELVQEFALRGFDELMGPDRLELQADLRERVQAALDRHETGIQVTGLNVEILRPAGDAARSHEDFAFATQRREQRVANQEQTVVAGWAGIAGDPAAVPRILDAIGRWEDARDAAAALAAEDRADPDAVAAAEAEVDRRLLDARTLISDAGGQVAQIIEEAERDRWVQEMNERGRALRIAGEVLPYRAAPEIYRTRALMEAYEVLLPGQRVYVLGIDPARVETSFDLKVIDPLFEISDAIETEEDTPR